MTEAWLEYRCRLCGENQIEFVGRMHESKAVALLDNILNGASEYKRHIIHKNCREGVGVADLVGICGASYIYPHITSSVKNGGTIRNEDSVATVLSPGEIHVSETAYRQLGSELIRSINGMRPLDNNIIIYVHDDETGEVKKIDNPNED